MIGKVLLIRFQQYPAQPLCPDRQEQVHIFSPKVLGRLKEQGNGDDASALQVVAILTCWRPEVNPIISHTAIHWLPHRPVCVMN